LKKAYNLPNPIFFARFGKLYELFLLNLH